MSTVAQGTIFKLLMSLEQDLRWLCLVGLPKSSLPLTVEERGHAEQRYLRDKGVSAAKLPWGDLIEYLDLSQTLNLIDRHRDTLVRGAGASER